MSAPVPVADAAAGQQQILRDLAAEYGRQLRQILQVGELIKGSVYQIETVAATRVATALLRAANSILPRCFPGARPAERACAR